MATIIAYGQFIDTKVGKDGLTVTVDCERVTRSDGTRVAHLTGASATAVGRRGLYYYRLTSADITIYDYVFTFITANTDVDQREIAALWTLYSLSWHDVLTAALTAVGSIGKLLVDMLDAATSTRSTVTTAQVNAEADTALADYDPPTKAELDAGLAGLSDPTAAQVADAVWDEATADHVTTGSFGKFFADLIAGIWSYATRTFTQPAAQAAAAATGETLTLTSYSTWTITLTGMGDISDRDNLIFTVKAKPEDDADTTAIVQVDEDNGLLYIGGAQAGDAAKATLTVTDETAGNITISVHASVTGLQEQGSLSYDVKKVTAAGVAIPVAEGRRKCHIQAAVTRATS